MSQGTSLISTRHQCVPLLLLLLLLLWRSMMVINDSRNYFTLTTLQVPLPPAWQWGFAYGLKCISISISIDRPTVLFCHASSALKEICIRRVLFRMIERPNRCKRAGTLFPLLWFTPTKWQRQTSNQSQTWVWRGGWRKLHKLGRFDKAVSPVTKQQQR